MRFLHLLSFLVALVLFVIQPAHATPYLELNFSGTFTDIADPYQRYNFDQGPFSGSIVLHGEGLLNESQNDYNAYYQFDRSYVDIVINGQEIAPLYLYYNLVRLSYSKSDDVWALAQAITVDQENFRLGTVNQDLFLLQYANQHIRFYDRTEEIADNGRGDITETRYDYKGTIGTVTAQQFELVQNPTPVPEPGTPLLLVSGLAVLALYHRRSMNK